MAPPVLSPLVGFRIRVVILCLSTLAYAHRTLQEVAICTELICGQPNTKQNTEKETTCDRMYVFVLTSASARKL